MAESDVRQRLQQLCVPEQKVRETYFSETFRQKMMLGGEEGVWDITHITIPFAPEKEDALVQRFGLTSVEELESFYILLGNRIKAEQAMLTKVGDPGCGTNLTDSFVSYRLRRAFTGEYEDDPAWAREYFLVSEPMNPIFGSAYIREKNSISQSELVSLALRLTRMLHELHRCGLGVHVGAFDLDTLCEAQNGGHDPAAKRRLVNTSLLYGAADAELAQLVTVPGTAHKTVRDGGAQTLDTDLYALGAFLWALSSGSDWTAEPDLNETPKYAPEALVDIMKLCLEGGGETALRNVHTSLRDLDRNLRNDPEAQSLMIPLVPPPRMEETSDDGAASGEDSAAAAAVAAGAVMAGAVSEAMAGDNVTPGDESAGPDSDSEGAEDGIQTSVAQAANEPASEPAPGAADTPDEMGTNSGAEDDIENAVAQAAAEAIGDEQLDGTDLTQPAPIDDPSSEIAPIPVVLGKDPALEGKEMVERSLVDSDDGEIDLDSGFEYVDEEISFRQNTPGAPQKAPLSSRNRVRQDVKEEGDKPKSIRNKILIPIIVVAAVAVFTLCAGHFFNQPAENEDDPNASWSEDVQNDGSDQSENQDQDQDQDLADDEQNGTLSEDQEEYYVRPDDMSEAEWAKRFWDDEDPDSLADLTGENTRGDINSSIPSSTTTVLPRRGGATNSNKNTSSNSSSSSKGTSSSKGSGSSANKNQSSNRNQTTYYVDNKPVVNGSTSNNKGGTSSANSGSTSNKGNTNNGSAANNANKSSNGAPSWLGAMSGVTPTRRVHTVEIPSQTGSPNSYSSQNGVFSVYPASLSLTKGEYAQLTTTDRCILRSSNTAVASVSGGRITGVGEGSCVVVATSMSTGASRTVVVSVHETAD